MDVLREHGSSDVGIDPFERFRQNRHFGSLDALRAAAVLAVVWHHVDSGHVGPLGRGYLGVNLFFVISGFLITTLLLRESDRGPISLGRFYARRSLRIVPLYVAVLLLYVVIVAVAENGTEAAARFWDDLPAFATYTFNWFNDTDPTEQRVIFYFSWSLATEEQFYLLWPPLLVWLGKRRAALALVAVTVVVFALDLTVWNRLIYDDPLGVRMLRSVPFGILLGVCLGLAAHHRWWFDRLFSVLGRPAAGPLALVAALGLLLVEAHDDLLVLAFAALVGAVTFTEHHPLARLTRWRLLVLIGEVSYGIYLFHSLVISGLERVTDHALSGFALFVVASIVVVVVALTSHRFFEQPFLRLKDRYRPATVSASGPAPGPGLDSGSVSVSVSGSDSDSELGPEPRTDGGGR